MKNTYNLLKQGGVGFMTCIGLDSYRRAVMRDYKTRESDRLLQDTYNKYDLAIKQIEEKEDLIASDNIKVVASVGRVKEGIVSIQRDSQNLANQISTNNNQGIDNNIKVLNKSTDNVMDEINKLMDKINSRSGSNNLLNKITEFLASYSTEQLGAISHILACITIFGCILNITIAYYGDFLLIYFKLEEKYPRLAKWIRLRRKFQHYYIALNILIIIFILLFVIYVNIVVLKYGK